MSGATHLDRRTVTLSARVYIVLVIVAIAPFGQRP